MVNVVPFRQPTGMQRAGKRVWRKTPPSEEGDSHSEELYQASCSAFQVAPPGAEQEGCIPAVFEYLWSKDPTTSSRLVVPGLVVPDTIVYKYQQPAYWYFLGNDGMLKRKHRANVSNDKIYEAFTRALPPPSADGDTGPHPDSSAVAAVYVYNKSVKDEQGGKSRTVTQIEHLTKDELRAFLFSREKLHDGILQQFVRPKGGRNSVLSVVWTPELLVAEQHINAFPIDCRRLSLYERLVTFEGEPFSANAVPIKSALLINRLHAACSAVVRHTAACSAGKVTMTCFSCHFKLDAAGRLWFLWCSSLRYAPPKPSKPWSLAEEHEAIERLAKAGAMTASQASAARRKSIKEFKAKGPSPGSVGLLPKVSTERGTGADPMSPPRGYATLPGGALDDMVAQARSIARSAPPALCQSRSSASAACLTRSSAAAATSRCLCTTFLLCSCICRSLVDS